MDLSLGRRQVFFMYGFLGVTEFSLLNEINNCLFQPRLKQKLLNAFPGSHRLLQMNLVWLINVVALEKYGAFVMNGF